MVLFSPLWACPPLAGSWRACPDPIAIGDRGLFFSKFFIIFAYQLLSGVNRYESRIRGDAVSAHKFRHIFWCFCCRKKYWHINRKLEDFSRIGFCPRLMMNVKQCTATDMNRIFLSITSFYLPGNNYFFHAFQLTRQGRIIFITPFLQITINLLFLSQHSWQHIWSAYFRRIVRVELKWHKS